MNELRREERHHATGSVDYVKAEQGDVIHTGLLSDMSDNGASIFTLECIESENVEVYFNGLLKDPIMADVMWCSESVDNLFKAGIRFRFSN